MLSSKQLKDIAAEARPIIERQLDDAELIAGFRMLVADNGGDWSALKALLKAQIQDERDESGNGKRVQKIVEKAEHASAYADMLGLAKMNENNFSSTVSTIPSHDPATGEVIEDQPETATQSEADDQVHGEVFGSFASPVGKIDSSDNPLPERGSDESSGENSPETATERLDGFGSVQDGLKMSTNGYAAGEQSICLESDAGVQGVTAGETAPIPEDDIPAFLRKSAEPVFEPNTYVLRPHCLNREVCAGVGSQHCHACRKAMAESEAA